MAERRLRRQHSSISVQFDPTQSQYYCCFGACHAKTLGISIFFYELVILISSAAFLFLRSASYTTLEWQSQHVLILVGISLFSLLLLAITTAFLFMGICYESSSLIIPYIIRQIVYVCGITLACYFNSDWICIGVPFAIFQLVLLFLSLGTYKYLSDLQAYQYKPTSVENSTAFSSSISRISHRNPPQSRISIGRSRPATIDFC
ncbi:hypothetical protein M3Y97_00560500 [Aphelenchoides bicaudatus]|nr:hypothetical protein M3Y97_00560500 [Aphelenchoides bicaudatus]